MSDDDEKTIGIRLQPSLDLDSLTGTVIEEVVQADIGVFLLLNSGQVIMIENHAYSDEDLFEALNYEMKDLISSVRKFKKISRVRKHLRKSMDSKYVEALNADFSEPRVLEGPTERAPEEGN